MAKEHQTYRVAPSFVIHFGGNRSVYLLIHPISHPTWGVESSEVYHQATTLPWRGGGLICSYQSRPFYFGVLQENHVEVTLHVTYTEA